jgi:FtsH-binding integral membrane protein
VAAIGLILLFVINIYLGRMEFPYFLISNIVWFVGMTIIYVGIQKRQAERKKDHPKTQ